MKQKIVIEWDRYKVGVSWTEVGVIEIEAANVEEALKKAEENIDDLVLPEGEYLDESFRIDEDTTRVLNLIKSSNEEG